MFIYNFNMPNKILKLRGNLLQPLNQVLYHLLRALDEAPQLHGDLMDGLRGNMTLLSLVLGDLGHPANKPLAKKVVRIAGAIGLFDQSTYTLAQKFGIPWDLIRVRMLI